MKTEVHFQSTAFNCTTPKEYFINPCCLGDDVCRWLIRQLQTQNVQTDTEPRQEDFGWYFHFHAGGTAHRFVVGFQPNDPVTGDQWLGWIERRTGFVHSLFGGRRRGIQPAAMEAIEIALKSAPDIQRVVWHEPER